MSYVDKIVSQLGDLLDDCEADLLRYYALLVLTVGPDVTEEDVHDAWALWRTATRPDHPSLVPFSELTPEVQALDTPYAEAIRAVAHRASVPGCGPACSEGHTYEAGCAIKPPARAFLGEPPCSNPDCPCGGAPLAADFKTESLEGGE